MWLLKTEPGSYSYDDLEKEGGTRWDGVKNPVALRNLKAMKPGDRVVVYHTGDEKSAVGLAEVTREAYADPRDKRMPVIDLAPRGRLARPVPVCADESCHDTASLSGIRGRYDAVNIKLDKTGGLTEALRLAAAARAEGLALMVGCMVATSLAMAPALLIAQDARWVDLDGPLLLARDREPGLIYEGNLVQPALPALWG